MRHAAIAALVAIACALPASTPPEPTPVAPPEPVAPPVEAEPEPIAPPPKPEPVARPEPVVEPETPPAGFEPIPAKRKAGFPGVVFTEVRAFAFDLHNDKRPICIRALDADGTPCSTVEKPGVVLTDTQTKQLLAALARRTTWGGGSACFLPHHGFVFYADGVPVADISVCFLCDMLESWPAIPRAKAGGEGGGYGLSEKGATELQHLCMELGLPKCDAKFPEEFGSRPVTVK